MTNDEPKATMHCSLSPTPPLPFPYHPYQPRKAHRFTQLSPSRRSGLLPSSLRSPVQHFPRYQHQSTARPPSGNKYIDSLSPPPPPPPGVCAWVSGWGRDVG
ncbi:hypothetical protein GX48_07188 [Paracoccidioides brasiliensis]|nr:hypothetical protein GX48_07188 [Paracoccidioides brasiliensis]